MNTAYWVTLMPRQQVSLYMVSYLSCPTSSIVPLHLGWPGSFNSSYDWTFKNDLDLLHYASSDPVFQFWVSFLCFCPGFCLGLWPLSPLQFGFSHFLVIFDYLLVMAPQMHLRSSLYWCFWKLIFPMLSLFSLALLLMWGHLVIWQIWATCHQKDWI